MKLGKIIRNFDATEKCVVYQTDTRKDKDVIEDIFSGYIMDIPWYIMDFYLDNDTGDFESIGIEKKDNKPYFAFYVRESQKGE